MADIALLDERIRSAKEREPLLFSEANPIENVLLPNVNGRIDLNKLKSLTQDISKHNLKLSELCLSRAKQNLEERSHVRNGPNV